MGIHTKQYQWFKRMDVSSLVVISTEGTSTVYPQIAVGISTGMPELFKRRLKQYRQMNVVILKP